MDAGVERPTSRRPRAERMVGGEESTLRLWAIEPPVGVELVCEGLVVVIHSRGAERARPAQKRRRVVTQADTAREREWREGSDKRVGADAPCHEGIRPRGRARLW